MKCPKCGRTAADDAVYCPTCGRGLKPCARSAQVTLAGALMIVASAGGLIIFVLSVQALIGIFNWYPPLIAQTWFAYDQLLTSLSFLGFLFGLLAAVLSLSRRSYRWTMIFGVLCTLSGGGAWAISLMIPSSSLWSSTLYYFLPVFFAPLVGVISIFPRQKEFKK